MTVLCYVMSRESARESACMIIFGECVNYPVVFVSSSILIPRLSMSILKSYFNSYPSALADSEALQLATLPGPGIRTV